MGSLYVRIIFGNSPSSLVLKGEVVEKDHISPSDSSSKYISFQRTQESESVFGEYIFSLLHEGRDLSLYFWYSWAKAGGHHFLTVEGHTFTFIFPNSDHHFECQLDSFLLPAVKLGW